ncbi:MAG: YihY family inner membrane protein [Rubrivivax sp.]|nr:YihY family inner membrane protein [Rubrivivax sp.]
MSATAGAAGSVASGDPAPAESTSIAATRTAHAQATARDAAAVEPDVPAHADDTGERPAQAAPRRVALQDHVAQLLGTLHEWPWFETLRTLRKRFGEDNLGLTASSLTFTTLIALVPLITVMLAIFSAFPMFAAFQVALDKYFLQALVPEGIARPVMRSLTQFAGNARTIGTAGLVVLVASALALVLTIDRTLNRIWRVRQPRPIGQRILVYWAGITLGPLVLGVSLTLGSYAISASQGWAARLPGGLGFGLDALEFVLLAATMAGLFHYVPNVPVRWAHAWAGAVFVAVAIEVAKSGLAWYLKAMPSFSAIYGAFATVPILLLWIYLLWVVVLLGAVVAAYAPSLSMRVVRRPDTPGQRFELAMAMLAELDAARRAGAGGLTVSQLAVRLRADPLQLEPVLHRLRGLDWVARLQESGARAGDEPRVALLCDPAAVSAAPLVDTLLLAPGAASAAFREAARVEAMTLAQLLPPAAPERVAQRTSRRMPERPR